MKTQPIDALAQHTARLARRRLLLTLGGTLMAAKVAAAVEPGYARKRNNDHKNNRKNSGKGKGADCGKRENQRCIADAAACKASVQPLCSGGNITECLAIQTCCEQCSAGEFLACLADLQQV